MNWEYEWRYCLCYCHYEPPHISAMPFLSSSFGLTPLETEVGKRQPNYLFVLSQLIMCPLMRFLATKSPHFRFIDQRGLRYVGKLLPMQVYEYVSYHHQSTTRGCVFLSANKAHASLWIRNISGVQQSQDSKGMYLISVVSQCFLSWQ